MGCLGAVLVAEDLFVVAQISDLHFGDSRFDTTLAEDMVDEINVLKPDLLVVAGDLTECGYREQYDEAAAYIDRIVCPRRIVVPGNHDARNVGYIHYREAFGPRYTSSIFELGGQDVLLVGVDTSKPDLNQGELGRARHLWLYDQLTQTADFKILVLHHHLVSVPGTGRERNILWDAGDILEILSETGVDLVMCGHKHVPYVWELAGMTVSTSGTASTQRTRGKTPPSFTVLHVREDEIMSVMRNTGKPTARTSVVPRRAPGMPVGSGHQRGREAAEAGAEIALMP